MSDNKTIAELNESKDLPSEAFGIKIPKLKHQWRLKPTGIMADLNLAKQIISCSRPAVTFTEIEIPHTDEEGITTRSYTAGKQQWTALTIVVEDDATGDAARVIQKQMMLQQEALSTNFSDYKFDIDIEYLDGDHNVTDTWNIIGCWLQQVDYTSLDYSKSEVVQMELTIRYDNAIMND